MARVRAREEREPVRRPPKPHRGGEVKHRLVELEDMRPKRREDEEQWSMAAEPMCVIRGASWFCIACGAGQPASRKSWLEESWCGVSILQKGKPPLRWAGVDSMRDFLEWASAINSGPERQGKHVIRLVAEGVDQKPYVECIDCKRHVILKQRKSFVTEACKGRKIGARRFALASPHGGGLRAGSFNTGVLPSKMNELASLEWDVLAVQELSVSPSSVNSFRKHLRCLGISAVFSDLREEDLVPGQPWRAKNGTGVALLARKPWSVHPGDYLIPHEGEECRVRHRIVSGVITNGTDRILMHGVYADPNDRGRINEEI